MGRRGKKPVLLKAGNYRIVAKERKVDIVPRNNVSESQRNINLPPPRSKNYLNAEVHIHNGGGLGDLITNYFCSDAWRYVNALAELYPNVKVTAVITTHNSDNRQLLETHPNVQKVIHYPWYPPGHVEEFGWTNMVRSTNIMDWAKGRDLPKGESRVWLSRHEEKIFSSLGNRKYIVIHPFAGLPGRSCLPHPGDGNYRCYPDYKYIQTANHLAEAGYLVKIIGHSPTTGERKGRNESLFVPDDTHPNVESLVNKLSLRQNVELVRRANGFLGSHSSMLCAAWSNRVPSIFFYPGWNDNGARISVREHGGGSGTRCIDEPWTDFFELRAKEFIELDSRIPAERLTTLMKLI